MTGFRGPCQYLGWSRRDGYGLVCICDLGSDGYHRVRARPSLRRASTAVAPPAQDVR